MDLKLFITLCVFTAPCKAVRLTDLMHLIVGSTTPRYELQGTFEGFLHIGNDYSILIRKPEHNDKYLIYELYETRNIPNSPTSYEYKPLMLAVSQIPMEYIKKQLRTFRDELHNATSFDDNSRVPGTKVESLREWQISEALRLQEESGTYKPLRDKPMVLRMLD